MEFALSQELIVPFDAALCYSVGNYPLHLLISYTISVGSAFSASKSLVRGDSNLCLLGGRKEGRKSDIQPSNSKEMSL